MCIPFAWHHEAVDPITPHSRDWLGSIDAGYEWEYADYMLLLTFGGIPWQVYSIADLITARNYMLLIFEHSLSTHISCLPLRYTFNGFYLVKLPVERKFFLMLQLLAAF